MIRDHITDHEQECEICIVGSGPVGLALALELERMGRRVLVLESGGGNVDPAQTSASRATITDPRRHAPMELAVCRAFGGTSWAWGGRCVAFDDVDFLERSFVPNSGWPLSHEAIKPWYKRASEFLLCGGDTFVSEPDQLPDLGPELSACCLERWSSEPQLAKSYVDRLKNSANVTVCLNSTVTGLDLGTDGRRIEKIVIGGAAGERRVIAQSVVLAGGGVETTRLLLITQRRWPQHFGGVDGPLGRFYMGHISGKIANIVFQSPTAVDDLDFELDDFGVFVRRRFTLSEATQVQHKLRNICFFPDNPPFHDPRHGNAVLSAVFLALAMPPLGRRILPEPIRMAHVGPHPHEYRAHLRNVLLGIVGGTRDLGHVLHQKFFHRPRRPGFLLRNREGRYALHYHAEQEPNPESRVTLNDEVDQFGMARATIDFRFTERDAVSVVHAHELLDSALRTHSVGHLEYLYPKDWLTSSVLEQACDGYHQVGTTRMGVSLKSSVVDAELKVHDLENLYIASSSVFPTTGQANSTYLAVALAVRLARHLEDCSRASATIAVDQHARR